MPNWVPAIATSSFGCEEDTGPDGDELFALFRFLRRLGVSWLEGPSCDQPSCSSGDVFTGSSSLVSSTFPIKSSSGNLAPGVHGKVWAWCSDGVLTVPVLVCCESLPDAGAEAALLMLPSPIISLPPPPRYCSAVPSDAPPATNWKACNFDFASEVAGIGGFCGMFGGASVSGERWLLSLYTRRFHCPGFGWRGSVYCVPESGRDTYLFGVVLVEEALGASRHVGSELAIEWICGFDRRSWRVAESLEEERGCIVGVLWVNRMVGVGVGRAVRVMFGFGCWRRDAPAPIFLRDASGADNLHMYITICTKRCCLAFQFYHNTPVTMSSTPTLEGLPTELLELVIGHLSFIDICSIRRASLELSAKASRGHFRAHFLKQSIAIDDHLSLQDFKFTGQVEPWSCLLHHVTVAASPVPNSRATNLSIKSAKRLRSLFLALKHHVPGAALTSLSLRIKNDNGEEPPYPRTGTKDLKWTGGLFQTVMYALAPCGIPVETLDVLGPPDVPGSILIDEISKGTSEADLSTSLAGVRILSLSLADPHFGDIYSHGVANLLKLSPRLEKLSLHWYNASHGIGGHFEPKRLFDAIARTCRFPDLTELDLRGIRCASTSLLQVLEKASRLEKVALLEVHLIEGSFQPIFHHLIYDKQMKDIKLDDLYEDEANDSREGSHIVFSGPGRPHYLSIGNCSLGPHCLSRSSEDRRKPIRYQRARGRPLGSAAFHNWLRKISRHYGPRRALW